MMQETLKTVTFCQSVPLRKQGDDEVMLDTIQTYYDCTEKVIKALATKFPGTDFTIERQSRPFNKMPKIETSESFRATKRYPSMTPEERAKFAGVAAKPHDRLFTPKPKPAPMFVEQDGIEGPKTSKYNATRPAKQADYAGLVNEMMKDSAT